MSDSTADAVSCTINGITGRFPKTMQIIEAAEQLGVGIPYYCYHPGLSAPAMCRMCLVEVEGMPKLAPACVTNVADGQVIQTESEKARAARRGTLEFYLYNHPLDCPVCDKSGECKLQDYVHAEGRKHGRSLEAKRVLGQDDFGGDILYDGDRCIQCTRCVRFTREISQTDALCVVQRGDRSVIDTFFDDGVARDPWAGNVIDICPVGALLSKDFLHKARVWDLDSSPSVCASCSQGCNIQVDTRDNLVNRLRPRPNPDVNSYWMCDHGRYNYEWLNLSLRIEAPLVRRADGRLAATSWQTAMLDLVSRLESARGAPVQVVGSPMLGNEDNGLLGRLAGVLGGDAGVYRSRRADDEVVCPGFPKLARRRDLAANVRGLDALGFRRVGDDEGRGGLDAAVPGTAAVPAAAEAGRGIIVILGDELADAPADFGAEADLFIVLGHVMSDAARNADFVLPVTTYAEQEGTFTNFEGRVQRFWPAIQPPPLARPAWQVLGVLLAGLDDGPAPADAGSAFLRIGELYDAFGGLSYDTIGSRGALLAEPARIARGAETN